MNNKAIIKSITRYLRKGNFFAGGRAFGLDYVTWRITFPQISTEFQRAAEAITGRTGRFLPKI